MTLSPRILLVEDDRENCLMLKEVLTNWGYSVTTAFSGEEALRFARSERFEIVLSDIKMPEVGGLQVLHEIRQLREGVHRHRGLVIGVVEGRVRRDAIVGMAPDEDRVRHAVRPAVIEHSPRAAEVDAVPLVSAGSKVRDGCHVNHCVGVLLTDDLFGLGLADVRLDETDAGRTLGPRPAIDAGDIMPTIEQSQRDVLRELPRDACQ